MDEKQSRLVLEGGSSSQKRVTFKDEEGMSRKKMKELIEELRKEFKAELGKLREEGLGTAKKVKELEEEIVGYEKS